MKTATPTPLRATPWILAEWTHYVGVARRSTYPTVLIDTAVLRAMGQEVELLRSRLATYQQGEGEKT